MIACDFFRTDSEILIFQERDDRRMEEQLFPDLIVEHLPIFDLIGMSKRIKGCIYFRIGIAEMAGKIRRTIAMKEFSQKRSRIEISEPPRPDGEIVIPFLHHFP